MQVPHHFHLILRGYHRGFKFRTPKNECKRSHQCKHCKKEVAIDIRNFAW